MRTKGRSAPSDIHIIADCSLLFFSEIQVRFSFYVVINSPTVARTMFEKAARGDPATDACSSQLPQGRTTEETQASSLREKSDDEKSKNSTPEDFENRRNAHVPHPTNIPDAEGRRELKEWEAWDKLAYTWPKWKKAMYLASIAGIQISMNFNTSVYPSAVKPLAEHFGISQQAARVGQMIYLVFYSFGCELWAPWSEEFGRWPILQLSLFFINIWQIPNSVAPNFGTIVVCRALVCLILPREAHRLILPGRPLHCRR